MFEKAREKYKDTEYKMLVAKLIDKYEFCKTRNKIAYTDFLHISERSIVEKILKEENIYNYVFFGGKEDADRSALIFYPDKITENMLEKNYESIFDIIRITLPSNVEYEHREFLSGIMKLGIKREKFGDIVVTDFGADIICFSDISKILVEDLKQLTRFRKAELEILSIKELTIVEPEFEDINIIVSSLRLDSFVSELSNSSRTKASEIINEGRVFINSINEFKDSKKIEINDIITIRGKGKFIFDGIEKETKSGRLLANIRKYK